MRRGPFEPASSQHNDAAPRAGPLTRHEALPEEWGPALARAFHAAARLRHLARRTESAYRGWVRRYLAANDWRHPATLGREEAVAFLSDLATRHRVSASTRNQALASILFLNRRVLELELPWFDEIVRAKRPHRLPAVLTRGEVRSLLGHLEGTKLLTIRSGKGDRDRCALLPESTIPGLRKSIESALVQHGEDLKRGAGWVELPSALSRKYPNAARSAAWQWVFPATSTYLHQETGETRRRHLHETVIQRAMRAAVRRAGTRKKTTCHTLRHSFGSPPPLVEAAKASSVGNGTETL